MTQLEKRSAAEMSAASSVSDDTGAHAHSSASVLTATRNPGKRGPSSKAAAPRPLERYAIRIASDGQIEVDKSHTFQEEMGQWVDPRCFIAA